MPKSENKKEIKEQVDLVFTYNLEYQVLEHREYLLSQIERSAVHSNMVGGGRTKTGETGSYAYKGVAPKHPIVAKEYVLQIVGPLDELLTDNLVIKEGTKTRLARRLKEVNRLVKTLQKRVCSDR